jgi:hypothetical protein
MMYASLNGHSDVVSALLVDSAYASVKKAEKKASAMYASMKGKDPFKNFEICE